MEERIIRREDGNLAYWVNARKSPVPLFFLHGAGVTHEMFNEQFSFFDPLCSIIAWDARLHGKSGEGFEAFTIESLLDDFLAVLDAEKIRSCHLIGQSMGGNLAQEIALKMPERVGKLVLIDCTRNLQKLSLFEKLMIAVSKPILNLYPFEKLAEASAQACSLRPEIQGYVQKCFLSMGRENFLKVFFETYNFVREDRRFKVPDNLLLICGEKDRTGNIRKSMKRWGAEPGVQYHSIPNAAHNSNQDQKKLVNGLIKAYLAI